MQNQGHTEEDDNEQEKEEDESLDAEADQTSPVKHGEKIHVKQEGGTKGESKITETKEASEINTLEERTDESDVKKEPCKIEGKGPDEKGNISVSSNAVDNKENETKGDDKQSLYCRAKPRYSRRNRSAVTSTDQNNPVNQIHQKLPINPMSPV